MTATIDAITTIVVFLDIDGVIVTHRHNMSLTEGTMSDADPVAVALLSRLASENEAKFVITSSWRRIYDRETITDILARAGMPPELIHDDWATPVLPSAFRGHEVEAWLQRHPEVERHVSVDDDSDYLADQPLVSCPPFDGLGFWQFIAMEAILQGKDIPTHAAHVVRTAEQKRQPLT